MRLSSLADYAVVMMTAAARRPGAASAAALAADTGVPLPTAQKLCGRLASAGLLAAARGAAGGVRLARGPQAISLADIIEAVEGPIAMTTCLDEARHDCALEGSCKVRPHWSVVNGAVREALAGVSLAALSQPFPRESGGPGTRVSQAPGGLESVGLDPRVRGGTEVVEVGVAL